MESIDSAIMESVKKWLIGNYDEATKKNIKEILHNNPKEVIDAFYTNLEFGTGGMRGIMGPGTNRMNIYTVGMATQGLANYLKEMFPDQEIKVVIAHDCRLNNTLFTKTAANVLSANGIKVFLFKGMRPTPELSFAVRYLQCQSGIVITASHNPKEYNGYKVYWEDGAQLVTPHDTNIVNEVLKINDISDVKFKGNEKLIFSLDNEIDQVFLKECKNQSLAQNLSNKDKIKIIYTPLHGTGGVLIPKFLKELGYTNTIVVKEQMVEDGTFPTVKSPNPEEATALELALNYAKENDADLVMATDPDADRIGIAVKDHNNQYVLLNGNQTGALIVKYILSVWKKNHLFTGTDMTIKTIVTSELLKDISESYRVKQYDVLTGFKWIADSIRIKEGKENFIVGLEESYGYMIGDFVRDKDSVTAAMIIAELATIAKNEGKSLFDKLIEIYIEYGFYKEGLINIVRPGKSGLEEISGMMDNFRNQPPTEIAGSKVSMIKDYLLLVEKDMNYGIVNSINLPKSNVLQFYTSDGSKISVRPSGTEPKIKFYFSVKENLSDKKDYDKVNLLLDEKITAIIESMGLKK